MKWIIACVVFSCLLAPVGSRVSYADMIPLRPTVPERKAQWKTANIPVYAVAAGVVAVSLTGSLVALRVIRNRNDK